MVGILWRTGAHKIVQGLVKLQRWWRFACGFCFLASILRAALHELSCHVRPAVYGPAMRRYLLPWLPCSLAGCSWALEHMSWLLCHSAK